MAMATGWLLGHVYETGLARPQQLLVVSESDGLAEEQDGAAAGIGFGVEDEQAVDGAGPPVGHPGAGAFQREAVVSTRRSAVARSGTTFCAPTIQIVRAPRAQRERLGL